MCRLCLELDQQREDIRRLVVAVGTNWSWLALVSLVPMDEVGRTVGWAIVETANEEDGRYLDCVKNFRGYKDGQLAAQQWLGKRWKDSLLVAGMEERYGDEVSQADFNAHQAEKGERYDA